MDIKEFISNFADQFDDLDVSVLAPETEFKALEDWNSLVALSVIAMIDEEYDRVGFIDAISDEHDEYQR